ncbi:phosphomannomutase [Loktanella sp. S4079]|uniref:phosphomannomutase n=1 Tax=Loktanella sp. S4079 TaxID=579483 RepID=UPI0005F9AC85|nr:phosphomannomutase [Loktanella sp. S4079]KJZ19259.1 phosphomannomutase [Loktanella sp. S4079]
MPPKFGTSGLRGLVTELTPECVGDHIRAFIASCPVGAGIYIGYDLRPSSPAIAEIVAQSAVAEGVAVTKCGPVPTPALALAAMNAGAASVMITGSHIPADRNGLKFYTPDGEITKAHEQAILGALGAKSGDAHASVVENSTAIADYNARYTAAYGNALSGLRVGVYAHSAVGRSGLIELIGALGAEVVTLGWSDHFIPVDTEAVAPELREQLRQWAREHQVDAIVSTDGDGDRPLLTDATGEVVPGDVLGQITAQAIDAKQIVTPVSSNSGVTQMGCFDGVTRTKIGSPYVIAGMEQVRGSIVGYEANGGFLLGFTAAGPSGALRPLMTRDAVLPIVAVLAAARGGSVADCIAAMPPCFTAADRLQEVPTERTEALVSKLTNDRHARSDFLTSLGAAEANVDLTDGLRMAAVDGRIIHLRPSGNAPELRAYVEANTPDVAKTTLSDALLVVRDWLGR